MTEQPHSLDIDGARITTPRLQLSPWTIADAEAALAIYGDERVARWLAPALDVVPDLAAMRALIARWLAEAASVEPPLGRWKVQERGVASGDGDTRDAGGIVGAVSLLPLPPDQIDYEVAIQIVRDRWGSGLAGEAGHAIAHFAFEAGVDEVFAVARPANERASAAARRMGMEWVGQTDKYYDLRLDVYRLRKYDLDVPPVSSR